MQRLFLAIFFFIVLPVSAQPRSVDTVRVNLTAEERELLVDHESILREVVDDSRQGFAHEVVALTPAGVSDVFRVVSDFESYPDFMPSVNRIDILRRTGDYAIVNYTLVLPLDIVRKYRLRTAFRSDSSRAILSWKQIEWPGLEPDETFRDTDGYWVIEADSQVPGQTAVLFRTYTDPGDIPQGLEWIFEILLDQNIPDMVNRVLRRAASGMY